MTHPEMHWSRWGDPERAAALPDPALALVDAYLGTSAHPAVAPGDVGLSAPLREDLLTELRALLGEEHVLTDHDTRLRRTRGKSTPDLLRLRAGDGSDSPDAVVRPGSHEEVADVLAWAVRRHVALVPFGGGTSVVGGLAARREGYAGVVCLDLGRLDRLLAVDMDSMTATLQAGVRGPEAEALLAEHGLTLGHFPQSFEYASVGGFAVTRSSGQSSAGYGRFDSLVVGLRVSTPQGELVLGRSPANAAGPDLRQVVMGSEGVFGVVTEVTVRVRHLPVVEVYESWRFDSFADGVTALRTLAQSGVLPTVLRLSDEEETIINLARPAEIGAETSGGCLVVTGYAGTEETVAARRTACTALLGALGGTALGEDPSWAEGRFHGPYLRDSLLDVGVLVETVETVTFWSRLLEVHRAVKAALRAGLGEATLVLCHVSHVYETGASLYFTVATKQGADPLEQWRVAKAAATEAMLDHGASITHHHAVGRDHLPWLERDVGPVGVKMLRALKAELDPTGVLNPGVLIP
jgi:alkyldihydroxyacetonephosphate synthase